MVGYRTNEFPAFFTPHSGQKTPLSVDSTEEAAELISKLLVADIVLISLSLSLSLSLSVSVSLSPSLSSLAIALRIIYR